MRTIKINIIENVSQRMDLYLSNILKDLSRNQIQILISDGNITINGGKKKNKYLLKKNDKILINIPEPRKIDINPQDINLDIIYEDSDIAVINKTQGMLVHPTENENTGTLVNSLLYHFKELSNIGGDFRPGIVHRLDRDTSGLMVIAKNNLSHKKLSIDFKNRNIIREYVLLVDGSLDESEGVIDEPIGRNPNNRLKRMVTNTNSRHAITKYKVLQRFDEYTLVKATLVTGRTHQIRVHFSYLNHGIIGDKLYSTGNKFKSTDQMLHAIKIGFNHPTSSEYLEFSTEIPSRFKEIIEKIK